MLDKLAEVERLLPALLAEGEGWGWNSLLIDYHHPHVWRLWRQLDDNHRVLLHKIHTCPDGEGLEHPHPWPSAVKVFTPYGASYETGVGYGSPYGNPPPIPAKFVLQDGSAYEMTHPNAWHYVRPLDEPIYSVMVVGKPFDRKVKQKRFGQGVEHKRLTVLQEADLFEFFWNRYGV